MDNVKSSSSAYPFYAPEHHWVNHVHGVNGGVAAAGGGGRAEIVEYGMPMRIRLAADFLMARLQNPGTHVFLSQESVDVALDLADKLIKGHNERE